MSSVRTQNLVLRAYLPDDWGAFFRLVQDRELMRHLSGPLTSDSAQALFARLCLQDPTTGVLGWAITTISGQDYCGHVFLQAFDLGQRSAELGFVLRKEFHGRRFAAEAAGAALEYARTTLGCEVVRATVDDDNEPSKATLTRLGMSIVSRELDDSGWYLVYASTPNAG